VCRRDIAGSPEMLKKKRPGNVYDTTALVINKKRPQLIAFSWKKIVIKFLKTNKILKLL